MNIFIYKAGLENFVRVWRSCDYRNGGQRWNLSTRKRYELWSIHQPKAFWETGYIKKMSMLVNYYLVQQEKEDVLTENTRKRTKGIA